MPEIEEHEGTGSLCLADDAQTIPNHRAIDQSDTAQRILSDCAVRSTTSHPSTFNTSQQPTSFNPLSIQLLEQHNQRQESCSDKQSHSGSAEDFEVGAAPFQHDIYDDINTLSSSNNLAHPNPYPLYRSTDTPPINAIVARERYQTSSVQVDRQSDASSHTYVDFQDNELPNPQAAGYGIGTTRSYLEGVGSQFES